MHLREYYFLCSSAQTKKRRKTCNKFLFLCFDEFSDWLHFIECFEECMWEIAIKDLTITASCLSMNTIFFKVNIFHERIFCNQEA